MTSRMQRQAFDSPVCVDAAIRIVPPPWSATMPLLPKDRAAWPAATQNSQHSRRRPSPSINVFGVFQLLTLCVLRPP